MWGSTWACTRARTALKNLVTPPLVEGNILSIEPGHYEAGKFGIRIENLALVTRDERFSTSERTWYRFQAVTLCPIDRRLIDTRLMTQDQVVYLNDYHRRVYRELSPHLDRAHRVWLKTGDPEAVGEFGRTDASPVLRRGAVETTRRVP